MLSAVSNIHCKKEWQRSGLKVKVKGQYIVAFVCVTLGHIIKTQKVQIFDIASAHFSHFA